jgi:signal transduction histidine kinase
VVNKQNQDQVLKREMATPKLSDVMTFKKTIRNLIIGKGVYIESRNEFRNIMLSGHYALLSLFSICVYFILELQSGFTTPIFAYGLSACLITLSLVMHRFGRHCVANSLLFPTLNILLFSIVSSESTATCGFLFFFPLTLSSSAVFNYSHRKFAVFFVLLSLFLLGLSISGSFPLIPYRHYSSEVIQIAFFRNVIFAFGLSVISIYLLISINHQISNQLAASYQQTMRLNEELDRFVYSTSHDLRAPLHSVKGLLTLTKAARPDEQAEYLQLMEKRIGSLDKFISDITDYSRNNRLEIIKESVNVSDLVTGIWDLLQHCPDAKRIEFKNEIPKDVIVINDATRMKVVLTNIISNAIRYHDRRKHSQYIRLYYQTTARSFSLHIEDNGIGIDPSLHEKIFDMYYRANESSQGSGLGLYIVKQTLAKLSGTIQITSSLLIGTTFSISIPLTE